MAQDLLFYFAMSNKQEITINEGKDYHPERLHYYCLIIILDISFQFPSFSFAPNFKSSIMECLPRSMLNMLLIIFSFFVSCLFLSFYYVLLLILLDIFHFISYFAAITLTLLIISSQTKNVHDLWTHSIPLFYFLLSLLPNQTIQQNTLRSL